MCTSNGERRQERIEVLLEKIQQIKGELAREGLSSLDVLRLQTVFRLVAHRLPRRLRREVLVQCLGVP